MSHLPSLWPMPCARCVPQCKAALLWSSCLCAGFTAPGSQHTLEPLPAKCWHPTQWPNPGDPSSYSHGFCNVQTTTESIRECLQLASTCWYKLRHNSRLQGVLKYTHRGAHFKNQTVNNFSLNFFPIMTMAENMLDERQKIHHKESKPYF